MENVYGKLGSAETYGYEVSDFKTIGQIFDMVKGVEMIAVMMSVPDEALREMGPTFDPTKTELPAADKFGVVKAIHTLALSEYAKVETDAKRLGRVLGFALVEPPAVVHFEKLQVDPDVRGHSLCAIQLIWIPRRTTALVLSSRK